MVKQLAFGKWILRGLAAGLLLPAALVEAAERLVTEELKIPKDQMKVEKWG